MGKGREKRKRRAKKLERATPVVTATPKVQAVETRDPRTRWTNTTARGGTPVQFHPTGTKVPVDLDSDRAPRDLIANTLNAHFQGKG
jgi:hypothetical protein